MLLLHPKRPRMYPAVLDWEILDVQISCTRRGHGKLRFICYNNLHCIWGFNTEQEARSVAQNIWSLKSAKKNQDLEISINS